MKGRQGLAGAGQSRALGGVAVTEEEAGPDLTPIGGPGGGAGV